MPRPAPSLDIENSFPGLVAGIDEAGRGPLAGPVVAAAVILNPQDYPDGLADSKLLTEKRREALAIEIREKALVGVGMASVEEIDSINILQATFLAMRRAVEALPEAPSQCIVDGSMTPKLPAPARAIVKGDSKSCSIAAASIIAKTTRDKIMCGLAVEFPHYAWEKNKGYGAPAHKQGLAAHGACPHHRKSFKPIQDIIAARRCGEALS